MKKVKKAKKAKAPKPKRTPLTRTLPGMDDPKVEGLRTLACAYVDAKDELADKTKKLTADLKTATDELLAKMKELKKTHYYSSELGVSIQVETTPEKNKLNVYVYTPLPPEKKD